MRKTYFLSVVEECVMNKKYSGYRGGRIEIHKEGEHYNIDEIRFFIPERFIAKFRDLFDEIELGKKEIFRVGEIDLDKYKIVGKIMKRKKKIGARRKNG